MKPESKIPELSNLLGFGLLLICFAMSLVVRFSNPDKTETRLLIDHWPTWILLALFTFVGLWILNENRHA